MKRETMAEAAMPMHLTIERLDWRRWPQARPIWAGLIESGDERSAFLSLAWVDAWLDVFGETVAPEIVLFRDRGTPVGACLLASRVVWRHLLPVRQLHLNCSGEVGADDTYIEYNGVLAQPHARAAVIAALCELLRRLPWDELMLRGLGQGDLARAAERAFGAPSGFKRPALYVDLASLREADGGYDAYLSANTRGQIRRSMRHYEDTDGALRLERMGGADAALALLPAFAELHHRRWRPRGAPGAFSTPRNTAFHERLIRAGAADGSVDLLACRAGERLIGVLYNVVHRGRVHFYQSGFAYDQNPHARPGLVTHYLAVRHYLERPEICEYDMMADASRYKRSLAKSERTLQWAVHERGTPVMQLHGLMRRVKRGLRSGAATDARQAAPVETIDPSRA